ncbi:MAG: ACT domain-containing protein [Candidatus Micrarchaeota archaeon]
MKANTKEMVIISRDRVGLLADISAILAESGINIESVSVEVVKGNAVIRMTTSSEQKAIKLLKKAKYEVISSDVVVVKLADQPGQLSKIARILADAKINIENVHLLFKAGGKTFVAIKADEHGKATELLKNYM